MGALSDYTRYIFSLPFAGFAGLEFVRTVGLRKFYMDDYPLFSLSFMAFMSVIAVFVDAALNPVI